jgi:hypothetical protein
MKFTYKSAEEVDKMEGVEFSTYQTEMKAHEQELQKAAIELALEPLVKSLKDSQETIKQLQEKSTQAPLSRMGNFAKELKDNLEAIKGIAKGDSKEVVIKAITNRASIAGNLQAVELPDVGQLATRKLSMYDIFPKVNVSSSNHNGTIRYYDWDEETIVRAAASIAEGGVFPESTAKYKTGTITIEKIGDTLPVTEEFFEDEEMFASELDLFLTTNVALIIDNQICNGTGAANTLVGVYASAPAFVPVASGIQDASLFDLIVKVAEDITVTGGSKYTPDTIIARRSVINQMKLKKDANNNYLMPSFVSADGLNVDGMIVIESNVAPANTLIICDRRFGKLYVRTGLELSRGLVGDQFTNDALTLKARQRMAFLIRNADKSGFRKVTSISVALVTLAS